MRSPRFIVIVGTGTGVGKTVLSSLLTRRFVELGGLRCVALKPLCSGGRSDARFLRRAAGDVLPLDTVNPWHFREPLAPAIAARRAGREVRAEDVVGSIRGVAKQGFDLVVVEGAGGLLSPLAEDLDARDLIRRLRATPVIVGANRLGALNEIFLTWDALPRAVRNRTTVVVMEPRRTDLASRTNLPELRERLGDGCVVSFPFLAEWENTLANPLPPGLRRPLDALIAKITDRASGPSTPR